VPDKKTGKTRPFLSEVTDNRLKADLKKYRQKALELGATDARILPSAWAQVDERVRLKCAIPPCPNYGRCGYCPPHTPDLDLIRKALARYKWAIFFKNDVPPEDFADIKRYYPHGRKHQLKTDEIAANVELAAFSDGYRFAMGLGAGGCRDTLCNGGLCQMLDSGRCPHILRTRPSLEAMGIDAVDLINKAGWEIYPVYRSMDPASLPCGISVGIVFIY
jgi:predicted metal-binding protein